MRWPVRRTLPVLLAVLAAGSRISAVTEPPPAPTRLGWYEWMGVAPIVVVAEVLADDGKLVQVLARTGIKGGVPAETVILVDLHSANRDRDLGVPALKLERGRAYALLLSPSRAGKREERHVFDLVRGIRGARPLPAEGAPAIVEAARRLGEIQERKDDALLWESLPEFLEETNPVLVEAALDLYVKFRRGDVSIVPSLELLLDHPRPDFRDHAALLLGAILSRDSARDLPERSTVVATLAGRARRDDDAQVRRTATAALASLNDAGIDEILRAIAKDDPDQNVRFEAEKRLYERSGREAARRPD